MSILYLIIKFERCHNFSCQFLPEIGDGPPRPKKRRGPFSGNRPSTIQKKPNKADIFVDIQRATLYNYCCSAQDFFSDQGRKTSTAGRESPLFRPPSSKRGSSHAERSPDFYVMEVSCNVPYLSAQEASALQVARLPQENGHPQRPQGSGPSSCQGSCPSDPLRSRKVHRA